MPRLKTKPNYSIKTVAEAKKLAKDWLISNELERPISFGLPEIDDRYNIWRVPLISKESKHHIGEVVIDAISTLIDARKTTQANVLESRLLHRVIHKPKSKSNAKYEVSSLRNTIALGDAETVLND